ncbi:diphthine methyl ester synthase-like [Argiope bruennichi]|uniref:diphthine methyl ester synthase n=1 Tax=Argiope bruennichi TaxID=94029 RepID=A0A8T0E5J1_ARGBR|nr:diphthine methyl ester synthase-like [Argiope bruennichi]KAF8765121.1 Diphthine methyl ester synthase like protein [Argiope bruennichi]
MLYFIGLGLGDPKDITVKGLEIVKKAKRVYLESYTSILTVGKEKLEEFYGREVIVADREMVEQDSDSILQGGREEDIAFLVVGDPFGATTHTDMILRAYQKSIPYKVVHNASIMNAVGCCGLQLYRFGETVSIVFWTEEWKPDSFYDKISINRNNGLHTLCLLDIKVKEQSIENLIKGKKIYEPPRFMTVSCAAQQLLEIIEKKQSQGDERLAYTADTICVGLRKVGSDDQKIIAAPLRRMATIDLGEPLHSLIICGDLHPVEKEMLEMFVEEKGCLDVCVPVESTV